MSTYEYNDLFLKCQSTGPYHVFIFDIKDSSKMKEHRENARIKFLKLNSMMYKAIQKKEQEENRKILFFGEGFTHFEETRPNCFGMKQEPFILGDMIGFTVYRNSITREEVINIFNEVKKDLKIDFEFHLADGYYETNEWSEANKKYFRGYCIDLLSKLHKPQNKNIREELQKRLK